MLHSSVAATITHTAPGTPDYALQDLVQNTGFGFADYLLYVDGNLEALTAVSVAALTIYDMVKAVEKSMTIEGIRLILKDGGKSGIYEAKP